MKIIKTAEWKLCASDEAAISVCGFSGRKQCVIVSPEIEEKLAQFVVRRSYSRHLATQTAETNAHNTISPTGTWGVLLVDEWLRWTAGNVRRTVMCTFLMFHFAVRVRLQLEKSPVGCYKRGYGKVVWRAIQNWEVLLWVSLALIAFILNTR